ncbi:11464_t:CDS:2 [Diversispora eburnea]|uniref:11464_t:CDS:1 n=1 Tax=Diversispora eburnea TaxID=1213867 RepID=A0A9N9CBL6_9GLOM|nr:11464_t:CDS:2 [Diversispora eburnea]
MSESLSNDHLRRTTTNYFTTIKQILRKETTEETEYIQEIEDTINETNDAKDIQTITEKPIETIETLNPIVEDDRDSIKLYETENSYQADWR